MKVPPPWHYIYSVSMTHEQGRRLDQICDPSIPDMYPAWVDLRDLSDAEVVERLEASATTILKGGVPHLHASLLEARRWHSRLRKIVSASEQPHRHTLQSDEIDSMLDRAESLAVTIERRYADCDPEIVHDSDEAREYDHLVHCLDVERHYTERQHLIDQLRISELRVRAYTRAYERALKELEKPEASPNEQDHVEDNGSAPTPSANSDRAEDVVTGASTSQRGDHKASTGTEAASESRVGGSEVGGSEKETAYVPLAMYVIYGPSPGEAPLSAPSRPRRANQFRKRLEGLINGSIEDSIFEFDGTSASFSIDDVWFEVDVRAQAERVRRNVYGKVFESDVLTEAEKNAASRRDKFEAFATGVRRLYDKLLAEEDFYPPCLVEPKRTASRTT